MACTKRSIDLDKYMLYKRLYTHVKLFLCVSISPMF
jgi:hypothetical protein